MAWLLLAHTCNTSPPFRFDSFLKSKGTYLRPPVVSGWACVRVPKRKGRWKEGVEGKERGQVCVCVCV